MWLYAMAMALSGYLFGSFPSGYLAGRIAGVDIRSSGSGNIGATNAVRVLGKRWGIAVFIFDAFKGFAAVRLSWFIGIQILAAPAAAEYLSVIAAVMCIIGHAFPVWLKFKGGKGVATSAGGIFGLMPLVAITILAVWIVVFKTTRYVSVASMTAAVSLPIAVALLRQFKIISGGTVIFIFSMTMAFLVLWRHRSNFSRLLQGTEPRFVRK